MNDKVIKVYSESIAGVVAGNMNVATQNFKIDNIIYGTATRLNANYFVTAKHVVDHSCADNKEMRLLVPNYKNDVYETWQCKIIETFTDIDLALLQCDYELEIKTDKIPKNSVLSKFNFDLPDSNCKLNMFDNVASIGYPFGASFTTTGDLHFVARGYKGHIVANYKTFVGQLPLVQDDIWIYELSYSAPKGLSGGPLYVFLNNRTVLYGVVVANSYSELVSSLREKEESKETETETDHSYALIQQKEIVHTEYLSHGIAVDIHELLQKTVDGKTVRDLIVTA